VSSTERLDRVQLLQRSASDSTPQSDCSIAQGRSRLLVQRIWVITVPAARRWESFQNRGRCETAINSYWALVVAPLERRDFTFEKIRKDG